MQKLTVFTQTQIFIVWVALALALADFCTVLHTVLYRRYVSWGAQLIRVVSDKVAE